MQKIVQCPILGMFSFLSKRWMLSILHALHNGETTFSGIKRSLPGMSGKILSERLQELAMEWYILRTVTEEHPPKVRYELTEKGHSFGECALYLSDWARKWNTVP